MNFNKINLLDEIVTNGEQQAGFVSVQAESEAERTFHFHRFHGNEANFSAVFLRDGNGHQLFVHVHPTDDPITGNTNGFFVNQRELSAVVHLPHVQLIEPRVDPGEGHQPVVRIEKDFQHLTFVRYE